MSLLDLKLDRPEDDESSKRIKIIFHDVVNGVQDPASAAKVIDSVIVKDCEEAFISYTSVSNSTTEQIENGRIRTPQPDEWLQLLWNSFGQAAIVIPFDHPGQDRLVSLLQGLQRMPLHKVPWFYSDKIIDKKIYNLTPENGYDYFQQWLWELDQGEHLQLIVSISLTSLFLGQFIGHQTVETDMKAAAEYMNFSAFLARLLAGGISAGIGLSALIRRPESPFCTQRIAWTAKFADSFEQGQRYQPYACAAAQWIIYAGDSLSELCNNDIRGFGVKWSRTLWDSWKAKFEEVVDDKRFIDSARDLARKAVVCMIQLEEGKGKTGTVQKFGLTSWREEEEHGEVE